MRLCSVRLPLALMLLLMSTIGCQRLRSTPLASRPSPAPTVTSVVQARPRPYPPEIQEYVRLFEARERLPDLEAVAQLQAIVAARPHSPAAYEAHVALARHHARLGDPAAETEYRAALSLEGNKGLALELARWLEEWGQTETAYAEYKRLLADYPQAFEAMRRVGADSLQVAEDLSDAAYHSDALEELRGVEDPDADPIRARALSGLGRHEEAVPLYRQWLDLQPEDTEARMGLARALHALGDQDQALVLYESVDTAESLLAQAGLWAEKDPSRAISLGLQCPYPVAQWEATALLESQNRITETLPLYAQLAEGHTRWADDAAYRLYVLADRLGDPERGGRAREQLASAQPNFFALRIGEHWTPPISLPFRPAGIEVLSKTVALESLGLEELAHRELVMAARFDRRPEARAAYAQALHERGDTLDAQRVAESLLHEVPRAPLLLWRLAYPQPYDREVRSAADEFDLDPLLLWSVMHTESRYDPEALSYARAQGLMQIIPSTAEWAAEEAGIAFTPLDIYEPQANLRLAAWYMRWLLDYFDGDLELAVTAYNGGPGNVAAWREQVSNRDDFFRWIGASESREYVNLVLTAHHVYQELERLSAD